MFFAILSRLVNHPNRRNPEVAFAFTAGIVASALMNTVS
jgi:hypothetical protein